MISSIPGLRRSGKSTILKQLQLMHGTYDTSYYHEIAIVNCLQSIQAALDHVRVDDSVIL